jgi:hypothetical protein
MSSIAVNAITDANAGNTATINAVTPNTSNVVGKNRIINGNMVIDQRNAGASVTNINAKLYTVDRFWCYGSKASKFTGQQNAGAVTPPPGFKNYLGITSSSAYTVGASEFFSIYQSIEGFNFSDMAWGTASASAITLSFWVRSSLTGLQGGSLINGGDTRSYPFSYTVNVANTWEKKSITIAGETTGSWPSTNTTGVNVGFNLGAGATASGTPGSWSSTIYRAPTGATSVVGTSGATFYITGVQLEAGSSATEFEHRQYGTELSLCQRYYQQPIDAGLDFFPGYSIVGGYGPGCFSTWHCEMRATPTVVVTIGSLNNVTNVGATYFSKQRFMLNPTYTSTGYGFFYINKLTASAEL